MSLLSVVGNSLSGFKAFTRKLDNLSHNVANMNSPGFKKQDSYFRELNDNRLGDGIKFAGSKTQFTQGDIFKTGQNTDLAIDGDGFFIIKTNDQYLYTRAGQFEFNEGKLVDISTGGDVLALSESGELTEISIAEWQSTDFIPTTEVNLSGNLSSLAADNTEFPLATDPPITVEVYDSFGALHSLTVKYTKEVSGEWKAEVFNESNSLVGEGLLGFTSAGSPISGLNEFPVNLLLNNDLTHEILFKSGEAGEFDGLTSFPSQTNSLTAINTDGRGEGILLSTEFNSDGRLVLTYSNGMTEEPFSLALANFLDTSSLEVMSNSLFKAQGIPEIIATADEPIVGSIKSSSLERSNVDVTDEFSEIIIIQRGYQACSQVLTVSNQMIEELYNSSKGR
ncbi:flagellar hook-basal body complex protein [uncultured Microbulbifer sp.]|uniref:flagellar hook-basal body complex protein n=1 Tax=uncultured Microbulbifer sp. TaxID=348147 RepID=UPI002614DFB8|nr:flagellar hook-basal body complex protein [uncultured Microbulbifer sp.]